MEKRNVTKAGFISNKHRIPKSKGEMIFAIALVLPAALMLTFTIIVPLLEVIRMSFMDFSLMNIDNQKWNNLGNYISLFSKKEFMETFGRTIIYVFSTVFLQFVFGILIALLLNSNIKGRNFIRGLLFLPWTIPTIVAAVVWLWIFQPQYGVLNYIITSLHFAKSNIDWLGSMNTAMMAVVIAAVWKQMPLMMVMLLAALQTVPKDLEEAALIDGANWAKKFFNVTIPCIMSVIKTVTLTSIITNFQMFVLFFTMTGGGPVKATTTLTVFTYETAFLSFDMGKGAAIGVIWLLFLILFSALYNKLLSKSEAFA